MCWQKCYRAQSIRSTQETWGLYQSEGECWSLVRRQPDTRCRWHQRTITCGVVSDRAWYCPSPSNVYYMYDITEYSIYARVHCNIRMLPPIIFISIAADKLTTTWLIITATCDPQREMCWRYVTSFDIMWLTKIRSDSITRSQPVAQILLLSDIIWYFAEWIISHHITPVFVRNIWHSLMLCDHNTLWLPLTTSAISIGPLHPPGPQSTTSAVSKSPNVLRAKDPKVRCARVCMTVAGLVLQGITGG